MPSRALRLATHGSGSIHRNVESESINALAGITTDLDGQDFVIAGQSESINALAGITTGGGGACLAIRLTDQNQ